MWPPHPRPTTAQLTGPRPAQTLSFTWLHARLRENFHLYRLMPTIVHDIQHILAPDREHHADIDEPDDAELVHLWDPDSGPVDAGVNYAHDTEG